MGLGENLGTILTRLDFAPRTVIAVGVSPMSRPWKIIIITETVVDHVLESSCTWATGLMNRGRHGHRDNKSLIFRATCET